jgi:predicted CoA-binding protein
MTLATQSGFTRAAIDDFLAHRRIAFVGLSTRPQDFSRMVYTALQEEGFDVVPVNHRADEIDGQPCFASVKDVSPPVQGALLMTPPQATLHVVEECAQVGISRVWMHRGAGDGSVSDEALAFCSAHDISVVPGQCPMMFLERPERIHRVHAASKRLWGTYPDQRAPLNLAIFLYAALGWLLCGAIMYAGMSWLSMSAALLAHALAAPLVFGRLAARYHRTHPGARPWLTAVTFTGTAIALDVVIVALLVERSFAMFASLPGTWIPFALIFAASWALGRREVARKKWGDGANF